MTLISLFVAGSMVASGGGFITSDLTAPAGGFCGGCASISSVGINFPGGFSGGQWAIIEQQDTGAGYRFSQVTTDWTWGGWIRFEDFGTQMNFFGQWDNAGKRQFLVRKIAGNDIQVGYDDTANRIESTASLSVDTWYFIAVTHEEAQANEFALYILNEACTVLEDETRGNDSADVADTPTSAIASGASQVETNPPGNEFTGQMAYEFYIEGDFLSAAEIDAMCVSNEAYCDEMEIHDGTGNLEWFHPYDGLDFDDCSTNAADSYERQAGAVNISAYTDGPH